MEHDEHTKQHVEIHSLWAVQNNEAIRVDRWHATYNAALSGIYSNAVDYGSASPIDTHNLAVQAANLAHGELPK